MKLTCVPSFCLEANSRNSVFTATSASSSLDLRRAGVKEKEQNMKLTRSEVLTSNTEWCAAVFSFSASLNSAGCRAQNKQCKHEWRRVVIRYLPTHMHAHEHTHDISIHWKGSYWRAQGWIELQKGRLLLEGFVCLFVFISCIFLFLGMTSHRVPRYITDSISEFSYV